MLAEQLRYARRDRRAPVDPQRAALGEIVLDVDDE
jgi:hypothetical protein